MKAYAGIFLLITGASPTEFEQFTYEEALEVEKSPIKKELSSVKFRAGEKKPSITLVVTMACRC